MSVRDFAALARMLAVAVALLAIAPTAPALQNEARAIAAPTIAMSELPPEARRTVVAIRHGGPFPYDRDGVVFGNFEGLLPGQKRGYYREYTVPTPGVSHRGARRIVAGRVGELYYTDDHYRSFRRIRE